MEYAGYYCRKDRIGRFWEAGYPPCCKAPRSCNGCQHCLIHVGELHQETRIGSYPLPILTDSFDEERGCWTRGVISPVQACCGSCIADLSEARFAPTLRLAPLPARQREERVRQWAAEKGVPLPKRRHLGGFVRAEEAR